MAFSFSGLPQQIRLALKGLSTGKLVAMVILVGGTIAGFAYLLNWSETGDLQPLYNHLAPEDAAQVSPDCVSDKSPINSAWMALGF